MDGENAHGFPVEERDQHSGLPGYRTSYRTPKEKQQHEIDLKFNHFYFILPHFRSSSQMKNEIGIGVLPDSFEPEQGLNEVGCRGLIARNPPHFS